MSRTLLPGDGKKSLGEGEVDAVLREEIGLIGREAEAQMLSVTGGVNTHKGAIWSLGLLQFRSGFASDEYVKETILPRYR